MGEGKEMGEGSIETELGGLGVGVPSPTFLPFCHHPIDGWAVTAEAGVTLTLASSRYRPLILTCFLHCPAPTNPVSVCVCVCVCVSMSVKARTH